MEGVGWCWIGSLCMHNGHGQASTGAVATILIHNMISGHIRPAFMSVSYTRSRRTIHTKMRRATSVVIYPSHHNTTHTIVNHAPGDQPVNHAPGHLSTIRSNRTDSAICLRAPKDMLLVMMGPSNDGVPILVMVRISRSIHRHLGRVLTQILRLTLHSTRDDGGSGWRAG